MSDQKFFSQIPEHLLKDEKPAMQFLMNELNKNTQATEYLLRRREESGKMLDDIKKELGLVHEQTRKTNGTVLRHTKEIAEILENKKDLDQIVAAKKIAVKLGTSKIFWIVFGCAIIGLLAVFTNVPLAEFLPFLNKGS